MPPQAYAVLGQGVEGVRGLKGKRQIKLQKVKVRTVVAKMVQTIVCHSFEMEEGINVIF
jgi:hypothetical protein